MELQLIDTANFYADGGAMFGPIPKSAWSRRYPSNDNNQCVLVTRSALIITDCGHIILIDNGAGYKHPKVLSSYQFFNIIDLKDELKNRGVSPEAVTDVILTHLHFDHCGYTVTRDADAQDNIHHTLAFPNATHWVSKDQWKEFSSPNPLEKDSYFKEDMIEVEKQNRLRLIENETSICPSITMKLFDGHTKGQIVTYIEMNQNTFVFAGDVIPLCASISPTWISAYDVFPLTSYNEKIRLLEEAADKHQAIIYCHDAYQPYSYIKKVNNFYIKESNP